MQYRWFVSILSSLLVACAGTTANVQESAAESEARAEASAAARKARPTSSRKATASATRKPAPEAERDAKESGSAGAEFEESSGAGAFAGVDTEAPTDTLTEERTQTIEARGIEGTMSEYDVRSTLESRDGDFDRCHDGGHGGGGRIEFRIHIEANGDVGEVKVHRLSGHHNKIVDCYTDVVAASHFSAPHGGYADVKWTTKVGRSRARPDAIFERKVRWDSPATGGDARPASDSSSSETRRERRHKRHHHRKGV